MQTIVLIKKHLTNFLGILIIVQLKENSLRTQGGFISKIKQAAQVNFAMRL